MPIYSHSRLSTFQNCPRQYWFRYIEKPEIEKVDGIEAFMGSRAHDALEELYKYLFNGRVLSVDEVIQCYEDCWEKNWHDEVRIVKAEFTAEDYKNVGRKAVEDYYNQYYPFDDSRTVGLERHVTANLDPDGHYKMRGFIDRLARRDDGTIEIHDYKTNSRLPTQQDADEDRQLALYQLCIQNAWPDAENVELIWHYLRFGKEMVSTRSPEQIEQVRQGCISLIDEIEGRGKDVDNFPTQPSALCNWCDYRELCPAMGHKASLEQKTPKEYGEDDGVKLVDRWAKVQNERKSFQEQVNELMGEESEIEQEVIEFARQRGIEIVTGSTQHAEVQEKIKLSYPRSNDGDREGFEAKLHETGLWDDVTDLDWRKLQSVWLDGEKLEPRQRDALQAFITEIKERKASLKKGGIEE